MILAAIMTAATVWIFCSCADDGMKDISERRSGYFGAADDRFTVTAVSGVREDPYISDGAVGAIKPYTLVTVAPTDKKSFDAEAVITYEAQTDDGRKKFGGALVAHPFAASYSAEFEYETTGVTLDIKIKCGGETRDYALSTLVGDGALTFDRAINAAKKELDDPSGEIRARLIKNPIGEGVCWHVEFITADGDRGVLLDAYSAKVLAKKTQP